MSHEVVYHPLVVRDDIPKLDAKTKTRIKTAIETKLTTHPELFGIPLRQSLKGHRKIRVGDYRVVFRLEGARVIIIAIEHRSAVYLSVENRLHKKNGPERGRLC